MPGTDDIAEKVADLLVNESMKFGKFVVDQVPVVKDGVVQGTNKFFSSASKHATKKRLAHLEEDGQKLLLQQFWGFQDKLGLKSDTIRVADEDTPEFERLLRQQKMVFSILAKDDDSYTVFIYLDKDRDKAQKAYNQLMARRGQVTEMPPDEFLNVINPDKLNVIDSMDEVETELFRFYAKEHGLLFSHLKGNGERPGQILYLPSDIGKARKVMDCVGWALTSAGGAKIREQVQLHIRGRSAINLAIEDSDRELYIVSGIKPGHAIHITEQDYRLYKKGELIDTVSRSKEDFYTRCMSACLAIPNAVVLTKEEFESPDITPQTVQHLPTIELFPRDTIEVTDDGYVNNHHDGFDSVQEQYRLDEITNLISQKISLDDEGNASWGLFDTSVSFSEFSGYENYQDSVAMREREEAFEHFKKMVEYNRSRHGNELVDMTDRNLDYVVSRAYVQSGTQPDQTSLLHEHDKGPGR